jgi:acylglycerol lipase
MAAVADKDYAEAWMAGVDGLQFYTRTYAATSPKAVLLFVHGFAEHVGRYEHVHVKYPTRGITLFTFDLRGYGRTALDAAHKSKESAYAKTSWHMQMRDIEFFAKHLAATYPGVPLFLMGHSAVCSPSRSRRPRELMHIIGTGRRPSPCVLYPFVRTPVA